MIKLNKIKLLLEKLGFTVDVCFGRILFAKLEKNSSYYIKIEKDYKGYHLEFTEFINNNFGKTTKLESTKAKDIIDFFERQNII